MTEKFNGTWVQDQANSKGFEEFAQYIGLDQSIIDMYKGKDTVITYKNSGDKLVCDVGVQGLGSKVYECKLGEPMETQSLDGSNAKMTVKFEGGKLYEETIVDNTNQCFRSVITVDGDKLITESTTDDGKKSHTTVFNRKN